MPKKPIIASEESIDMRIGIINLKKQKIQRKIDKFQYRVDLFDAQIEDLKSQRDEIEAARSKPINLIGVPPPPEENG